MYYKAYESSTEYKTAEKQDASAKKKDGNDHTENRTKAFYSFVLETEEEKVYYFALCYKQHTLIVTAPSDNSEQEKFLGYGWSNRKGDEGIKIKNEALCDTLCGYLYNDANSEESIARYVKDTFLGIYRSEGTMQKYVNTASLKDMIDFTRTTFDKAIKTSVTKKVEVKSKYELVKLGDVAPYATEKIDFSSINVKDYISTDNMLQNRAGIMTYDGQPNIERITKYIKGDILISNIRPYLKKIWFADRNGGCSNDVIVFRIAKNIEIIPRYLYEYLSLDLFFEFMMNGNKGVKMPRGDKNTIPSFMLPLPPLEVQQQIVAECEQIDDDYKKAKDSIENCKQQIESIMQNSQKSANIETKLSNKDVFDISIGRRILSTEISEEFDIPVYSANVFEPFGKINKLLLKDFDVDSVIWGIDGDWMVNVLPANYQFFPTDHCGVLRIKDNYIEPKYIAWVLNKAGEEEGFKRSYRASIDRIEGIVLNLPPLKTQKQIVAKITAIEGEIQKAKEVMDQSAELKAAVLKKYLE